MRAAGLQTVRRQSAFALQPLLARPGLAAAAEALSPPWPAPDHCRRNQAPYAPLSLRPVACAGTWGWCGRRSRMRIAGDRATSSKGSKGSRCAWPSAGWGAALLDGALFHCGCASGGCCAGEGWRTARRNGGILSDAGEMARTGHDRTAP
jgi:hypothetical protein